MSPPRIGVLALQGAADEHRLTLDAVGATTVPVRRPDDLCDVDGLVVPGGESTTMSLLIGSSGLGGPLRERLRDGLPVLGTCAGMILLATDVVDGRADQCTFGRIDLTVRRNGFGRQRASFEADLDVDGLDEPFRAVFIRAPLVESVGPGVEVLAEVDGPDGARHAALCRSGSVLVSAFHPELTDDDRIHRLFLDLVGHDGAMTRSGVR